MYELNKTLCEAETIMIAGHVRPDGDCIGACVALQRYIKRNYPKKEVFVYIETVPEVFEFLDENKEIFSNETNDKKYDVFIALDCSSPDRLGDAQKAFYNAKSTMCIDHHISNRYYAGINVVNADASSTCEVLYELITDEEKISDLFSKQNIGDGIDRLSGEKKLGFEIIRALYIGIIFDTGVFRFSNTSKRTMDIAGELVDTGIPFWKYIDECFLQRTYTQTQLLGRTLLASMRVMDGKCIVATITRRMMEFYEAKNEDIEGIVDQLRITQGVEVAILLHEIGDQEYKVSLRSNDYIDVSKIASFFGGGGHVKAAGFTMRGSAYDVVNNITGHIESQMLNKNN